MQKMYWQKIFSISGGERTRANRFAAKALLARVYLALGQWADAESEASNVLANSCFRTAN